MKFTKRFENRNQLLCQNITTFLSYYLLKDYKSWLDNNFECYLQNILHL